MGSTISDETNPKNGLAPGLIDTVKTFALVAAIMLIPRTVLCQPFIIPSGSMEPTLLVGDYILVSQFPNGISRHSALFSPPLGQGRLFGQRRSAATWWCSSGPATDEELARALLD